MAEFNETVIDHIGGIGCSDDWCGVSTGEKWLVNKLERLAEENPEEVECIAKNKDGNVYYHVPWKWIRIQRPPVYTDEQKERFAETLRDAQQFNHKKLKNMEQGEVDEPNLRENAEVE